MKLLGVLAFIGYAWGMWKFWKGYRRTNFSPSLSNRVILSVFWPVFLVNQSYRKNFQKALKG